MKKAVFLGLLPFLLVSCGLEEASSSVSSPPVSSEPSSSSSSSVSSAPSSSLSSSSSSSRGKGSDLHNLRVSCAVMNNRHGNDAYDEEGVPGMWYPNVISDGSPAHRYEGDHRAMRRGSSSTWLSATRSSRLLKEPLSLDARWGTSTPSFAGMRKIQWTSSKCRGTEESTSTKGTGTRSWTIRS